MFCLWPAEGFSLRFRRSMSAFLSIFVRLATSAAIRSRNAPSGRFTKIFRKSSINFAFPSILERFVLVCKRSKITFSIDSPSVILCSKPCTPSSRIRESGSCPCGRKTKLTTFPSCIMGNTASSAFQAALLPASSPSKQNEISGARRNSVRM